MFKIFGGWSGCDVVVEVFYVNGNLYVGGGDDIMNFWIMESFMNGVGRIEVVWLCWEFFLDVGFCEGEVERYVEVM